MVMEEKKVFAEPICEVERFCVEDIITTSSGDIEKPGKDNWDTDEF